MAAITITVTMVNGSTMNVNASIADADVARLLAAMAVKYRMPEGETSEWLIRKWTEEVIVDALNYTKGFEQQQAAQAASAQIELIPVTIS